MTMEIEMTTTTRIVPFRLTRTVVCGLTVGLTASSCLWKERRVVNEDHCANQDGNDWCRERYEGDARPYCVVGVCGPTQGQDGCVAELPTNECYSPCGNSTTVLDDDSCLVASESSSGSTTGDESSGTEDSGSSSSTTGPMPCVSDEECTDEAAPFCGTAGECGTCEATKSPDAACAGVDPLRPLCVGEACVACTPENPLVCDEQLLLCDGASNACVPCEAHEQCESGACQLAVGTCFPTDFVVEVDGDGGQDYPTVVAAVSAVAAGGFGVIVVHDQESGLGYPGTLVDGGKTIALLAAPGESPILQGTGGNPGLGVIGAGTILYMDGMRVSQGGVVGMRVDDAFAWVDRSRIVQNSGGGVLAENGAELTLRNCFVGGDVADVDAVSIDASGADIVYTTVAGGNGSFGMARALSCTANATVDLRNSFLVAIDDVPELACSSATVSNTASETAIPGSGNETLGPVQAGWFAAYPTGDFHLASPPVSVSTTARWQTGDPPTDLDADLRPTVNDTPDYAGADVP